MPLFENKVVWITGASSGIGRELALQLAAKGSKLVLSARNESELLELEKKIGKSEQTLVLPLDITRRDYFAEAFEKVKERFGRVDILANNAGVSQRSYVLETDVSVDERLMNTNFLGTVALTKVVLPQMVAQGGGHFIVTSSVVGKFGFGVRSAYSASKHALHGFFESLLIELYSKNIGITIVCPGPINTPISKNALGGDGKPTGEMDEMQAKGMPVEECVRQIIKAVESNKREVVVAGFKERLGVKLKAWMPGLFFKMAMKQNPRGELKL